MKIFMEVTRDKYELPLIVADSSGKLAMQAGVKQSNVTSSIAKHAKGERKRCRFIMVEVEDESEGGDWNA